ncbi:MAG: penicillin-binding protein 2 [Gammaproteobacteria bacterium]|nr:penicillin-binding protein 2 [Gammaproteobacteria bacterium]
MSSSYDAIKNLHRERLLFTRRVVAALVLILLLVAVLGLRLVELQVLQYGYYETRSNDNRMRVVPVPPVRGLIYDRNGALLAQNLPSFDLVITPDQVAHVNATVAALRQVLPTITDDDVQRFHDRLLKTPRYRQIPLRSNLSPEEVARFELDRYRFPGVDVAAGLVRDYPLGTAASHVIGYVNGITETDLERIDPDLYQGLSQIGRAGVERSHEDQLRGTPGTKIIEANAAGRPLRELNYQPGTPGENLYLTIDARLQAVAERSLGDLDGAVVALDPRNGEVLALVSKPGYDPAMFVQGLTQQQYQQLLSDPHHPLYDRALLGTYAPGSTIKPFMAFAGLQAGTLTADKPVFCPGYLQLPGSSRRYRCWKRSGHGWLTLPDAIAQSCDVYFYNVALNLGIDRIDQILADFGFGRISGIDLPNEKSGLLPSPAWKQRVYHQPWYPGETLNVGIGQGYLTVTPMQLALAVSRIAMHGSGFAPHLVHAYGDPTTGRISAVAPQPLRPIAAHDATIWGTIVGGMEKVTQDPRGTAYRIGHDAPYPIAGKTGSAQVIGVAQNVGYQHAQKNVALQLRDNALFIAFAPAGDPKIAVAVIAEHGAEGALAAAPVAREVMDQYLLGQVLYHDPNAGRSADTPAAPASAEAGAARRRQRSAAAERHP